MGWCAGTFGRRAVVACASIALAALTIGSCALTAESIPAPPAAAAKIHGHWAGCQATRALSDLDKPSGTSPSGPPDTGSVPADFEATTALLCSEDVRTTDNGDRVKVALERRSDDITALLSYLSQPSQISTDPDLTCAAMGWTPPWLFLRDARGRWLAPALPLDACGFPLGAFTEPGPAYATLRYRDRVVKRGRVIETAAARRAGCEMGWKDMVAVEAARAAHRPLTRADPFDGADIRLCVYAVAQSERSSSTPSGEFRRGEVLSPAQRRTLLAALTSTRAAGDCTEGASQFALLQPVDAEATLYVELDGCRRILDPGTGGKNEALARADERLIRLLVAAGR